MINMYFKYCFLFLLGIILNSNFIFSQEVMMAPKNFVFSWQKANGDEYEIPVENNLEIKIEQQRVNRALMQILLKSILKSRDFEGFDPLEVTLLPDEKNQVAIVEFSKPDNTGETQQFTYYFTFDTFGNVFNQL
tara:strand:+ start:639 stop:1040 length:402 start_codon:yes stop_codon:yes gene_type:complete